MVVATGCYRLSHVVAGLLLLVQDAVAGRATPREYVICAVGAVWSAALFAHTWRRGWFATGAVWTDVALCGLLAPATAAIWPAAVKLPWAVPLGNSAAAIVGVRLRPVPAALVVAGIAAVDCFVLYRSGVAPGGVAVHANSVIFSAVLTRVFWWYLSRQGELLDAATRRALDAEATRSAERARFAERAAQYRALHDTVLSTLTAIARGGVDVNAGAVRERCAREADYLRRLLVRGAQEDPGGLTEHLERVIRSVECLGLRVVAQYGELPGELPPAVAAALGEAAGEALNNVLRHSGTPEAWVSASGGAGGVVVTVTDRGRGFAADATPGLGLRASVHDRVAEVGGGVRIDSAPGDGTWVELRWPA
ncbi:histidine kinase [Longispora fulva]|nr:histidine kinase [Longispora fulva]